MRSPWSRKKVAMIILILWALFMTLTQISGWSAVFKENQNITGVLQKTIFKSKQALQQRYQHIHEWGKSLEHHYNGLKVWGKSLTSSKHIRRYRPFTCGAETKPHRSIFYVKVHDTKSDILRNIFLIYGREYNLTVCMDAVKMWSANWPYKIDKVSLTKTKEERCQIVAEQLVYSTEIVDQIMTDDVFVLASVRHPVQHFISVFRDMDILKAVRRLTNNKTVTEFDGMRIFLQNPKSVQKTYVTYSYEHDNKKGIDESIAHQISLVQPNLQSFSLGITELNSQDEFNSRLKEMHLIAVAERFDESMLVLREKLCCSIEDLVYRKDSHENVINQQTFIPEDLQKLVLEFNDRDARLYKHALRELQKELDKFKNLDQLLGIYHFEMDKYEKKCTNPKFPDTFKNKICPPLSHPDMGGFVMGVLREQKERLLRKLRIEWIKANSLSKN